MLYTIKTATACYTGGGIYIYYGQLENGLYFRTCDDFEAVYICDADTSAKAAEYSDFYEQHTQTELIGEEYKVFFNKMLSHVLNGGRVFDKWSNYQKSDLIDRIIK